MTRKADDRRHLPDRSALRLSDLDRLQPVAVMSGPAQPARRQSGNAWMVTFTDLIALLLTFFVMVFAMRDVEEDTWQTITNSFVTALDTMQEVEVTTPRFNLDVERVVRAEGADLNYLYAVIENLLDQESLVASATLEARTTGVAIQAPRSRLLTAEQQSLSEEGRALLFHLAGVLGNLPNALELVVEVPGRAGDDMPMEAWAEALRVGGLLAGGLAESGYVTPVEIRARWAQHDDPGAARVDLLILPDARQ